MLTYRINTIIFVSLSLKLDTYYNQVWPGNIYVRQPEFVIYAPVVRRHYGGVMTVYSVHRIAANVCEMRILIIRYIPLNGGQASISAGHRCGKLGCTYGSHMRVS